jgi:hypothetical protein
MFVAFALLLPIDLKLVVIVRKIHNHVHSTFRPAFPCYTQYTLKSFLCIIAADWQSWFQASVAAWMRSALLWYSTGKIPKERRYQIDSCSSWIFIMETDCVLCEVRTEAKKIWSKHNELWTFLGLASYHTEISVSVIRTSHREVKEMYLGVHVVFFIFADFNQDWADNF